MGLFEIFKKKEEKKKEKKEKKEPIKIAKPKEKEPEAKKEEVRPRVIRPGKKIASGAYRVLAAPHITEKATMLSEKNKYTFRVQPGRNKIEIKRAVEEVYGIEVTAVRVISVPRKRRRLGKKMGWRKGYRKAIVSIKKGQKIEIMPR